MTTTIFVRKVSFTTSRDNLEPYFHDGTLRRKRAWLQRIVQDCIEYNPPAMSQIGQASVVKLTLNTTGESS